MYYVLYITTYAQDLFYVITIASISLPMREQFQLIGGAISGCDVIFDNSSDGYSCKHAAVYWKYQLYTINLSTLSESIEKTCVD